MIGGVIDKIWLGRQSRRMVLPCILLILGALGSSVHASCGDWLQHAADPSPSTTIVVLSDVVAIQSLEGSGNPLSASQDPRTPCSGPHCRQQPPRLPAPAAPVIVVVSGERLGFAVATFACELELQPLGSTCSYGVRPAKGFPPRITHPPRV